MYKCKECGAKYEIKPEYCECGNDSFVKVLSTNSALNIKLTESKSESEDFDSNLEDFREIENPQQTNYKDDFNELPQPGNDKVSIGIFALCVFFAFLVLFFIGNPKKETKTNEQKAQTVAQTKKDIPALDSFWDNTPVKVEIKQPEPQEEKPTVEIPIVAELPKIVQQIIPQPKPQEPKPAAKNTTTPKTTQQAQKPKTTTTFTQKPVTTQSKPSTPTKTTSTQTTNLITKIKNNQNTQPAQTQTQAPKPATSTTTAQQTPVQAPKPNTTTQTTTAQNTQAQQAALEAQRKAAAAQAAAQAAKQAAVAKQELASYKTSLRNSIGRKIDFTSVVGDGSCSLSFKIASNGRLTNRVFTKQSSNLTLNEAVYSAMNATPSYNPPPNAYHNETLNLTIKFYNGNFEISLN